MAINLYEVTFIKSESFMVHATNEEEARTKALQLLLHDVFAFSDPIEKIDIQLKGELK
jgi:hypothetical protein